MMPAEIANGKRLTTETEDTAMMLVRAAVVVRAVRAMVRLAAFTVAASVTAPANSMAQDSPIVPTVGQALKVPPQDLAAAYLTIDGTATMVEAFVSAGFESNLTLDGKAYAITKSNEGTFLAALRARLDIYRQAIEQRGFARIAGDYALDASASCRGKQLDLRELFGKPMASQLSVRQTGFKADLVLSTRITDQQQEIVFPGVAVQSTVVFAVPNLSGVNLWGSVKKETIELRPNVEEMQNALVFSTVPESDWRALANCVFTLTLK